MPKYEVITKTLEPQLVASIREVNSSSTDVHSLFCQVAEYIESQNTEISGPGTILCYNAEEGPMVETLFPISRKLPETDKFLVYELPRVEKAACVVFKGTQEDSWEPAQTLDNWIKDNGYCASGPKRILFLECDEGENPPGVFVVETQIPIKKA